MRPMLIILAAVPLAGYLASCDSPQFVPCDKPEFHPSILFGETFESYPLGSFPGCGWQDSGKPYYEKVVDIPANHKMLLDGPSEDTGLGRPGIYTLFKPGTMKPTYVRYKMHPYPHLQDPGSGLSFIGNFSLSGFDGSAGTNATGVNIFFIHNEYGYGSLHVNGNTFPKGVGNLISLDKPFLIELRNIHWETTPTITFDLWIDGKEVERCMQFKNPIESIDDISIYNRDYGRIHFDDIFLADLPVEGLCPHVSADPPGPENPPLPPPPSPTSTRPPLTFIIQTGAFCREGPGTGYPRLATFPEGARISIDGQNLEGGWWWSEAAGCWISDVVGELIGPWQPLPIILALPVPEPQPAHEPGRPSGCQSGMGQEDCLASGGAWDDQPGQPGACICP